MHDAQWLLNEALNKNKLKFNKCLIVTQTKKAIFFALFLKEIESDTVQPQST